MALSKRKRRLVIAGGVAAAYAVGTLIARSQGYSFGRNTVVRCRQGHLFSTLWIPGASLKSVRLGPWRLQRCPVGRHWSLVTPVKEASLSSADLDAARATRDARIP